MEIIYTRDPDWLKKWDSFIKKEDKGSHLLLSDWIKSYQFYGFDYEICIGIQNDSIVGGYAAVIPKALAFKFYVVPYGPIVLDGFENNLNELITTVPQRAVYYNSCYCHITIPYSKIANRHVYNFIPQLSILKNVKQGHLFRYVYSSNGLNWVDFESYEDEEKLLESFNPSIRRHIRFSIRKGLECRFLETEEDVKLGYELCIENAVNSNYPFRDWISFRETLLKMINDKSAKFIGAFKDGSIKGASFIVESGNYCTYIFGGTKKEKPDLQVGHFLHWAALKYSFDNGLSGYNISLGGSKGVIDFKNRFANEQIYFESSKYYWILKPFYFQVFLFFEKNMRPFKKQISKILSIVKKRK